MKPMISSIKFAVLTFSFIFMTHGCIEKPKEMIIDDSNVRVIELDHRAPKASDTELDATTAELSEYDCDLNWILFDFNSFELTNTAKLELEKIALILDQNDRFKARLRAFTDNIGSYESNKKLSSQRAEIAKQYLISEGVLEKNISIDGFSDAKPIAINTKDDTGRKYNRRIELFILDRLNNTVCRSHPPEIPKALKVN